MKIVVASLLAWGLPHVYALHEIDFDFSSHEAPVTAERELRLKFSGRVVALELLNAATDTKIGDIADGKVFVIDPAPAGPSLNIRAVVTRGSGVAIQSVKFAYGDMVVNVDKVSPYSFCRNNKADYFKCPFLGYGSHTVSATPFSGSRANGKAGPTLTVSFTVSLPTTSTKAPVTTSPSVSLTGPVGQPIMSFTAVPAQLTPEPPMASNGKSPSKAPKLSTPTTTPVSARSKTPTLAPVETPMIAPTKVPVIKVPAEAPVNIDKTSNVTTNAPTRSPTKVPLNAPSMAPTKVPHNAPSMAPIKVPLTAPSMAPTKVPVNAPSMAPTKTPISTPSIVLTKLPTKPSTTPSTKAPTVTPARAQTMAPATKRPTAAPSQPLTYVPGKATVRENGMILSQGLTSRLIAQSGIPVKLANGQQSIRNFHTLPDGAAIFRDPASSSYKYVSNSEAASNAGVGIITFDQHGNITAFERIQPGTMRHCGGGKTFWNTWLTCEEHATGHVWEIDPFTGTARKTLLASPYQAPWESAAYDNRDPTKPTIYVTADKVNGPLLRFTPSAAAVTTARATGNYSQLLHTVAVDNKWEYLVLTNLNVNSGTFAWTTNVTAAEDSAGLLYKGAEGLDIRNGYLYFTAKTDRLFYILNLDQMTYVVSSTVSGAFNGQPDQVARLLDDVDQDILYFCEDVGTFAGVHGRDANGKYYTIVQGELGALDGETSGLAFGPGNMLMYVSFQSAGKIFEIRRTDGRPFSGQRLDIKYHDEGTNLNPFIP